MSLQWVVVCTNDLTYKGLGTNDPFFCEVQHDHDWV